MFKHTLCQLAPFCLSSPYTPAYEGEGTGDAGAGAGAGAGDDPGKGAGSGEQTLDWAPGQKIPDELQAKLNSIVKKEKEAARALNEKMMQELEAMRKRSDYSEREREELDTRITELQEQLMTKEELARKRQEQLAKEHETKLTSVTQERDGWKNRYVNTRIENELTSAAVKHKAYNPGQIITLLRNSSTLVETMDDDGKPNGHAIEISVPSKDKDGKNITLKLTPDEAVKHISELPEHQNLFESDGSGGLGRSNQRGGETDPAALAANPEAYRKNRSKILQ